MPLLTCLESGDLLYEWRDFKAVLSQEDAEDLQTKRDWIAYCHRQSGWWDEVRIQRGENGAGGQER